MTCSNLMEAEMKPSALPFFHQGLRWRCLGGFSPQEPQWKTEKKHVRTCKLVNSGSMYPSWGQATKIMKKNMTCGNHFEYNTMNSWNTSTIWLTKSGTCSLASNLSCLTNTGDLDIQHPFFQSWKIQSEALGSSKASSNLFLDLQFAAKLRDPQETPLGLPQQTHMAMLLFQLPT